LFIVSQTQPNISRGLLIGPLFPVIGSYVGVLLVWPGSIQAAIDSFIPTLLYGIPISYGVTFILGVLPADFLARRGLLTPVRTIALGPVAGLALALLLSILLGWWPGLVLWCAMSGLLCSIGFSAAAWGLTTRSSGRL